MSPHAIALTWRTFRLWKQNNAPDEYEDACAGDPSAGRFAIADGASEAWFAGEWARLLVEGFVADSGRPWRALDWLSPPRAAWAGQVDGLALDWYGEEKREQGAFATFLGLVVRPPRRGQPALWRALAVGDCCLFQVRGQRLVRAFPLTRSAEFGNRPRLLRSRAQGPEALDPAREQSGGRWRPGDRFLLMTDALAQWFLRSIEEGGDSHGVVQELLEYQNPEAAFPAWIDELRSRQGLRNDDVTLAVIDALRDETPEANTNEGPCP